jgi:hypothetical protein
MSTFVNYTFTIPRDEKSKFEAILARQDPADYEIVEEMSMVKPDDPRYSDYKMVANMDPETCLTFRMGMKNVKIRRARTEEELAEEKELADRHKIKVTVHVPMSQP